MLVDIIRMPPSFEIATDRRITIATNAELTLGHRRPVLHWPTLNTRYTQFTVGSLIPDCGRDVYKTIHVSRDHRWVFETVYMFEGPFAHCLYTKMIAPSHVDFGVSLNTVRLFQDGRDYLIPTSRFFFPEDIAGTDGSFLVSTAQPHHAVVPIVLGSDALWHYVSGLSQLVDDGVTAPQLGGIYTTLNDYVPNVLHALLTGTAKSSPFNELMISHPSVDIQKDRWFCYQEVMFSAGVRHYTVHHNHPVFDSQCLRIMGLRPARFSISSTFLHALDGLSDLWLTQSYHDPYHYFFQDNPLTDRAFRHNLTDIFAHCVMLYCRLFALDIQQFYTQTKRFATVTITKTIGEEIAIKIDDPVNDNDVIFYTSFPALALTTLAVGWFK